MKVARKSALDGRLQGRASCDDDTPMIRVRGLWKVYGAKPDEARALISSERATTDLRASGRVLALADVSFKVAEGQTYIIMGLSGSGKSTLVRCLNRLVEPTAGTIEINGRDVTTMDTMALRALRANTVSMVFQHFALLPHRRVLENVMLGLEVQGLAKTERERRAMQSLELVGLESWAEFSPQELSGGMQQRVGLARALAVDPLVLLLDEPFSGLDPVIRTDMQDELIRLQRNLRKTIVFITHDLDEALLLGDRIGVLHEGRLIEEGTPRSIALEPRTDRVRRFVRHANMLNVLTAEDVMVPLGETSKADLNSSPFVTDRDGRIVGVRGSDAAAAGASSDATYSCVALHVLLRDFLNEVREHGWPAGVVNGDGKLVGYVTRDRLAQSLTEKRQEVRLATDAIDEDVRTEALSE